MLLKSLLKSKIPRLIVLGSVLLVLSGMVAAQGTPPSPGPPLPPPPDSSFSGFDLIQPVPGVPLCTPLTMNWDHRPQPYFSPPTGGETHQWYVQAIGLGVTTRLFVANHGKQTLKVFQIVPPPISGPLLNFTVDATNLCQPAGGFLYANGAGTFATTPGRIYRIDITMDTLQAPSTCQPLESGRHYKMIIGGAKAYAIDGNPTFTAQERPFEWLIHHDTQAPFSIGFSQFSLGLNPSFSLVSVQLQPPMGAPFSMVVGVLPFDSLTSGAGQTGMWRMDYDPITPTLNTDHHHRVHLAKQPTLQDPPTDLHLYRDWMSCFREEPSGGKVTGGGNKGQSDRDFGFNIQQDEGAPPKGQLEYQDKVAGINFHSEEYRALVVFRNANPPRAIFWGRGTINGELHRPFVVSVTDADEPGNNDTFQITIFGSNPPQSISSPVITGGNIQIHK